MIAKSSSTITWRTGGADAEINDTVLNQASVKVDIKTGKHTFNGVSDIATEKFSDITVGGITVVRRDYRIIDQQPGHKLETVLADFGVLPVSKCKQAIVAAARAVPEAPVDIVSTNV